MTDNPVLGVNFGTHDAAAALIANGRVLAAAEEERFTRLKHTKQFPHQSARWCLNHAGVNPEDLAAIALFVDPRRQLLLPVMNTRHAFPTSLGALVSDIDKYRKRRRLPSEIRRSGLALEHVPIRPVAHHLAHAASAYLLSSFVDATVVTIDGRGEYETACVFEGRDGRLQRRHAITYPHSIGYLYSMVTHYLGFRPQRDEYKVMGLAAYGSPAMADQVGRLASLDPVSGKLRLNLAYFDHHRRASPTRSLFSPLLVELLGPPRSPSDDITARHHDIAYATQRLTERLVLGYLRFARQRVGSRNLCLAGGVALNGVANAAAIACGEFDQVFVQPAAGDAGTSIGAALVAERDNRRNHTRTSQEHTFLGSDIDECDVRRCLDELPACYQVHHLSRPHERAAELLHEDKIIGWCRGPMEFGPRALGHRSILAAPHRSEAVHRINAYIKGREDFRPLAPAVLAEDAHEYFDVQPAGRHVYPYMLATAAVRGRHRYRIPAVVHVDGSARVQTVHSAVNRDFWLLIDCYRARSGLPIVLNTSLNHSDEPIVRTPSDAVGVPPVPHRGASVPLPDLGHDLHIGLELQRLRASRCWLNRVAIEMLYGRTPSFRQHRKLLVPRLLDGPVQMELWTGQRIPLAHATKFLFRHVLSSEKVTNLVHLSRLTSSGAALLEAACDVGGLDGQPAHDSSPRRRRQGSDGGLILRVSGQRRLNPDRSRRGDRLPSHPPVVCAGHRLY